MGLYKFCILFFDEVCSFADYSGALMMLSVEVNPESKEGAVYKNKMYIL